MLYLAWEIFVFLLLACGVGFIIGWLLWGRHITGASRLPTQARRVAKPAPNTDQLEEIEQLKQQLKGVRQERDELLGENERLEQDLLKSNSSTRNYTETASLNFAESSDGELNSVATEQLDGQSGDDQDSGPVTETVLDDWPELEMEKRTAPTMSSVVDDDYGQVNETDSSAIDSTSTVDENQFNADLKQSRHKYETSGFDEFDELHHDERDTDKRVDELDDEIPLVTQYADREETEHDDLFDKVNEQFADVRSHGNEDFADSSSDDDRSYSDAINKDDEFDASLVADEIEDEAANVKEPPDLLSEPVGTADDLKKIRGIGPKTERILNDLGIYHFWQIAEFTQDNIVWMDEWLDFKGKVEREQWVDQANELAAGRQTAFSLKHSES